MPDIYETKLEGCPRCASMLIEYQCVDIDQMPTISDALFARQEASCNSCNLEWEDIYKFAGVMLNTEDIRTCNNLQEQST